MEYLDYLYVPKERLGILIGDKGRVKNKIEKSTGVKIKINSETGEVDVKRQEKTDPLEEIKAANVIKAIAEGFNPQKAMKLLEDNYSIRVLDFADAIGKNARTVQRQRARLIGSQGKSRKALEERTNTNISISGKEVAILGRHEDVSMALEAIEMLLTGVPHGDVYRFIDKTKMM